MLAWDTAIAGDEPIEKYEVFADNVKVWEVAHQPQTSKKPYIFEGLEPGKKYTVAVLDRIGRNAISEAV